MLDKKKIFGLAGIIVATTVSTVLSQWMTDKEIDNTVKEVIAEKERVNKES